MDTKQRISKYQAREKRESNSQQYNLSENEEPLPRRAKERRNGRNVHSKQ